MEPGTATRHLIFAIFLSSDVFPKQFLVCAADGVCIVNFSVHWTNQMVDLKHLHRKLLYPIDSERTETYHPKIIVFANFFKAFSSRNVDSAESVAKFTLPFQIQTHKSENVYFEWSYSTARIVYGELRGHDKNYGVVKGDSSFKTFQKIYF